MPGRLGALRKKAAGVELVHQMLEEAVQLALGRDMGLVRQQVAGRRWSRLAVHHS